MAEGEAAPSSPSAPHGTALETRYPRATTLSLPSQLPPSTRKRLLDERRNESRFGNVHESGQIEFVVTPNGGSSVGKWKTEAANK
ncbi:hypothetical protein ACOMHN_000798 [Nucella lapillus]